jgi:hypothetical protein
MDIYVAPTIINLENPTFWISNFGMGVYIQQKENFTISTPGNTFPNRPSPRD